MMTTIRRLVLGAALLLAAVVPGHAYRIRTGDIYDVAAADRVSAKQLVARDIDILGAEGPYIKLEIDLPGRVYIRHVEDDAAVAAGRFGKLRVSGDTRGAVDFVTLPGSNSYNKADELVIRDNAFPRHNTSKTESLLLEIEFYKKNVLKQLKIMGSADVVVLESVVYVAEDGFLFPDGTELEVQTVNSPSEFQYAASPGRLFVSDPKAKWTTSSLYLTNQFGDGGNLIQIEVAAINSTQESLSMIARANSNFTIFASEFVSPIFLINITSSNLTTPRNPLCVSTRNDVNFTAATVMKGSEKESVIPGGSICEKLPLPPREPALIRDDIDSNSEYLNAAKTATPAPSGSSSASQLVGIGGAAALAAVLSSVLEF